MRNKEIKNKRKVILSVMSSAVLFTSVAVVCICVPINLLPVPPASPFAEWRQLPTKYNAGSRPLGLDKISFSVLDDDDDVVQLERMRT